MVRIFFMTPHFGPAPWSETHVRYLTAHCRTSVWVRPALLRRFRWHDSPVDTPLLKRRAAVVLLNHLNPLLAIKRWSRILTDINSTASLIADLKSYVSFPRVASLTDDTNLHVLEVGLDITYLNVDAGLDISSISQFIPWNSLSMVMKSRVVVILPRVFAWNSPLLPSLVYVITF